MGVLLDCTCRDPEIPENFTILGTINVGDFMNVLDHGHMKCFGRINASSE